ncbi:MAG: phenylalanine--tRNA ligase beta subunit-related protein [Methanomicrobiales archaeon]|nr:phenylalanine--tRNA ligase beta subunit-related protein [Methanomicrobiales archaeon]
MHFDSDLLSTFPGIAVAEGEVRGARIAEGSDALEERKKGAAEEIRSRYTLERVKDEPLFRAYRDFFWRVEVDPTKTRPASEALVRRVLAGKELPRINTAVDAYNIASMRSGIPIAAFDADTLKGALSLRFALGGEGFQGIGMEVPVVLKKNQLVMTDEEKIVAIYPYRDSHATRVTVSTRNVHIVICGVPGIRLDQLLEAYGLCRGLLEEFTGGRGTAPEVSPRVLNRGP